MGQWRKVKSKSRRNGKRKAIKNGTSYPPAGITGAEATTIIRAAVDAAEAAKC